MESDEAPEGGRIEAPQGWLATPLHGAARRGDAEAVQAWLRRGTDPNARSPETLETPLHFAANGKVAALLLAYGAELEARDEWGEVPLHGAAGSGNLDVMRTLIAAGAKADSENKDGETPLFLAAREGHVQAAVLLLTTGADVNAVDGHGQTALHHAARHEKIEVVKTLLQAKADPCIRDRTGAMPRNYCLYPYTAAIKELLLKAMGSAAICDRPCTEAPSRRKLGLAKICFHPERPEAVTVAEQAILTRWDLTEPSAPGQASCLSDPNTTPRMIAGVQAACEGFCDVRFCPGTELFLAVSPERIELRRWEDLGVVARIERPSDEGTFMAADVSSDGRWIAAAHSGGFIYLFQREPARLVSKAELPEGTPCVRFDPAGRLLAVPCSDQGGGRMRIYELQQERLSAVAEVFGLQVDRSAGGFEEAPLHVAFSQDGARLAVFDTAGTEGPMNKPKGWRGNIILFETGSWSGLWRASIDARLTGDQRSLEQIGCEFGFFTEVVFVNRDTLACGATRGQVLLFRCSDGTLLKRVQVDLKAPVVSLGTSLAGRTLWAALGSPSGSLVRVPF